MQFVSIRVEEGEHHHEEYKRKEELPNFASRKVVCDGHDLEKHNKKINFSFIGCRFHLYFFNHSLYVIPRHKPMFK